MERRLAAIMATDVVGYSRLIRADEEGTLAALKALRADIIDPKIAERHGRIVKLMGDGMLVEFASVVDAVHAAVQTQQAVSGYNAEVPKDKRIELRIGINLGDVVIDGDDIQGDGVNVAARLEAMAEPGGICVSGMVYEGVRDRIDVPFEDLGEQEVKNIERPVRVWRWLASDGAAPAKSFGATEQLPLPDKPSIAVLPFENMSGDAEQEYFADGITEDIITELARFRSLLVIARNSSFTYKGRSSKVQDVAADLNVRYVVEGSVRKAGDRVRVTAQLIDAASGNHLWADRYDRELVDIFALQDEITQNIVSILPGRLEDADVERARRKQTANMTAYDHVLLGLMRFRRFSRDENAVAREEFRKAIELDPLYAHAHALLASTDVWDVFADWQTKPLDEAFEAAQRALTLDDFNGFSHAILGYILFQRKQDVEAEIEFRRAVALNPNDADAIAFKANVLVYFGRWEEALDLIRKAMRLNPFPPSWYYWFQGLALYSGRDYEAAMRAILKIRPQLRPGHAYLAACLAHLNRMDEARTELDAFLGAGRRDSADADEYARYTPQDLALERASRYRRPSDARHFLGGLRKAGLPE
jgi:adenylate cyclase